MNEFNPQSKGEGPVGLRDRNPQFSRMARVMIQVLALLTLAAAIHAAPAAKIEPTLANLAYKTGAALSVYEKERCKLDLYLPEGAKGFATLVWFHGGGLTGGSKDEATTRKIARTLAAAGLGVAVPNYRLSPKAKYPAYIEDAAAAVAWTCAHIAEHGGNAKRLFIGGHSAGGYLTLMLGLDPRYLKAAGVDAAAIAGLIPVSGQVMTHYTVRAERGLGQWSVTADEAAPVYFAANKAAPPLLVLYADHDMAARAEENAYLVAALAGAGNKRVTGRQIADRTHGTIASKITEENDPARLAILEFIKTH